MKITQKLRETFAKLEFEKRRHIYSYYGKRLTPVTNLINEFYEEFNTQKHATRVAKREGVPVEVVIQRWADKGKRAADFGTSVHDWAEDYANAKFFSSTITYPQPRNNHEIAAMRYLDNLPNYMQPVALELRMFSKEFDFAGTCDLLFYNHRTQKYIIGDWKTSESLFSDYDDYMYPPFQYLLDTPYNRYQLQLSLYHLILEEVGYEVEGRQLIWLLPDGNFKLYMTKDFRKLLKQHFNDKRSVYA